MTTDALNTARQQVADLEKQLYEEISAKAALLGLMLAPADTLPAPITVKYSDGNANTWNGGRGKRPKWVKDIIDAGGDIEKYRVAS